MKEEPIEELISNYPPEEFKATKITPRLEEGTDLNIRALSDG